MSYLHEIENELAIECIAKVKRQVGNMYKTKDERANVLGSVQDCLEGRKWVNRKPKKRTAIAHRLLRADREAKAKKLAEYMGWEQ